MSKFAQFQNGFSCLALQHLVASNSEHGGFRLSCKFSESGQHQCVFCFCLLLLLLYQWVWDLSIIKNTSWNTMVSTISTIHIDLRRDKAIELYFYFCLLCVQQYTQSMPGQNLGKYRHVCCKVAVLYPWRSQKSIVKFLDAPDLLALVVLQVLRISVWQTTELLNG